MEVQLIDLPEIAVIGKEGLCSRENNIVPELWARAKCDFDQVAELGMKEKDGSYVGFWGVMSDKTLSFKPWEDDYTAGMYLAGVEVYRETPVPAGWTKWIMPARTYLVTAVTPDTYGAVFRQVLETVLPSRELELAGAVCDYTRPATGENKLFFPVRGKVAERNK